MTEIKDLNNYVLFVFKDRTNDNIVSTTDIEFLKRYTSSESFVIGDSITFLENEYIIKDVAISKIKTLLNNDHSHGWSAENIEPQGKVKDVLFRVTVSIEEQLD